MNLPFVQEPDYGDLKAAETNKAPGISDITQAWQEFSRENKMMDSFGLRQSLEYLNMEPLTPQEIMNILYSYEDQNDSYGITEKQFYEVIEGLRLQGVGGGRKRKTRKSRKLRKTKKRKGGKKSRKTRK